MKATDGSAEFAGSFLKACGRKCCHLRLAELFGEENVLVFLSVIYIIPWSERISSWICINIAAIFQAKVFYWLWGHVWFVIFVIAPVSYYDPVLQGG